MLVLWCSPRLRVPWLSLLASCCVACGGSPADTAEPVPAAPDGSRRADEVRGFSAQPPRVDSLLLITVDTLRWDALGFAGNPESETPTLDRLAERGRVFLDAHAHNVVTLPSHANILTGLYPYQTGVRDNKGFVLPEMAPTAATLLKQVGFATAAFVGAFPLDSRFGLDRGFDVYDDQVGEGSRPTEILPDERRGDEVVQRALAWWRAHAEQRRFLWVHLYDPHAPYDPPGQLASSFAANPYLGEVAAVDAFLAPLLEPFLEGRETPTLIVFTSDHGEALGDHGEMTHGMFAYEATLKVPLVLWHPGIRPSRDESPARHIDLLPTMLEAAGARPPPNLPGRSLFDTRSEAVEVVTYFEALTPTLERGWAPLRGVVRGSRKFISLPIAELYDLEADPAERDNLAAVRLEEVRELSRLLPTESDWPPAAGEVDDETAAALRSLGYLGGRAHGRPIYQEGDDPKNLVHLDRKMHQVVDLYHRQRLGEAAIVAREVVEERPDMGIAYYLWAQVLLEKGELTEAVSIMEQANQKGVATPALIRQLGLSLSQLGRANEAVELLHPLARDGEPNALNALGLALSEAGRQGEAEQVLRRVFERDPRNALAHEHLALVALRREAWPEAANHAREALALNDELALSWNYLGTAAYNRGQPREALEAWDRALALEPANLDVLYNVSVVAAEVGDRERARRALRGFIDSAPPERYGRDLERARALLRELEG